MSADVMDAILLDEMRRAMKAYRVIYPRRKVDARTAHFRTFANGWIAAKTDADE